MAQEIAKIMPRGKRFFIFKASYDKANRTSGEIVSRNRRSRGCEIPRYPSPRELKIP
jgi:3-deoxy-D-manno-octulosonic acid (KDO) 8-phosphate synthase